MATLRHIDFNPPGWGEFAKQTPRVDHAHRQAVLADRPLAFWPLDEAAGATQYEDLARGNHHGVPNGSVTPGVAGPLLNDPDTATEFSDGSIETANLESFGTQFQNGFTFACWIRSATIGSDGLISSFNPSGNTGWLIQLNRHRDGYFAAGRIRCFMRDDDERLFLADADIDGLLLDNAWHHLAVTFSPAAEELFFYVDGQPLVTSYSDTDTLANTSTFVHPLTLAAFRTTGGALARLKGTLSHVSLFSRPLTPQAVAAHHQAGVASVAASLAQSTDAAHPDDRSIAPLGVRATLASGNAGVYQQVALASSTDPIHARLTLAPAELTAGRVTPLRLRDAEGRPVAWLSLHADRTVTLETAVAVAEPAYTLPDLPWVSLEIELDLAAASATLHVDGRPRQTLTLADNESVATIELGAMNARGAAGAIDLDDWVVADGAVGPMLREPLEAHAADPARWLVVHRSDQPDSVAWADAYRTARDTPLGNLLGLETSDDEIVDASAYDQLRDDIHQRLHHGPLGPQVAGILLGPGIPGLVDVDGDGVRLWPIPAGLAADTDVIEQVANPLGTGPLDRPAIGNLAGRRLVARIDGEPAFTQALIDRAIDRSTQRLGVAGPAPRLYIDPHGLPEHDSVHNPPVAAWADTADARSLRLAIHATHPDDRSFDTLTHDTFFFGYEAGAPPTGFFDASPRRVAFVQLDPAQADRQTLRANRATHWPGAALDAGYAVAIAATKTYSPSFFPQIDRFFAALSLGWSVGEAWHACRPALGSPTHLIGDPLTTVAFPAVGHRVYGPAASVTQALASESAAELAAAARHWPVSIDLIEPQQAATVAVTTLDEHDRENHAADAVRLTRIGDALVTPPLRPIWPRREGWPVASPRPVRVVWDRALKRCGAERVVLERQDISLETLAHAKFDAATESACFLEAGVPLDEASRRYRWRMIGPGDASIVTPWSAWTRPIGSPLPAGPALELTP